jgi:hypothetical protein
VKRGPKGPQYDYDDYALLVAWYFQRHPPAELHAERLGRNAAIREAVKYFEKLTTLPRPLHVREARRRRRAAERGDKIPKLKRYAENSKDFRRRLYDLLAGRSLDGFAEACEWQIKESRLRRHQPKNRYPVHETLQKTWPERPDLSPKERAEEMAEKLLVDGAPTFIFVRKT